MIEVLAAVKTENAKEIIVKEMPDPNIAVDEVLVEVAYCGVCGSDLHAYTNAKGYEFVPYPIVLGHEIVGTVIQCGENVDQHLLGKNVVVESMHYCGKCRNCRDQRESICENIKVIGLHYNGGMAQKVKAKAQYIREIPESLPMDIAVLSEPLANAVHAVMKVNDIGKNDIIHVIGPGVIGFFIGLTCVEMGAKVYISGLEKDYESRLKKAEKFGMIANVVEKGAPNEEFDVVFECSGANAAFHNAFNNLRKGGRAVVIAMYEQETQLFLTRFIRNEWPIITTYGCAPKDYELTFNILQKYGDRLKEITQYFSLNDVNDAFEAGLEQKVLKPIISIKSL